MRSVGTVMALAVALGAVGMTHEAEAASHHSQKKTHAAEARGTHKAHATKAHAAKASGEKFRKTAKASHGKRELTRSASARHGHHMAVAKRSRHGAKYRYASAASISCVPYAREVSGIEIRGNAYQWWNHAAGVYARGQRPEPGSVLAFRSSGGMRLGHVSVVDRIVNSREVLVDHANWEGPGIRKGSVMHNVSVIDVSPENDWSAVRVQVGYNAEEHGRVYPTYGFIYDRPSGSTTEMSVAQRERRTAPLEEVAEAPDSAYALHQQPVMYQLQGGDWVRHTGKTR